MRAPVSLLTLMTVAMLLAGCAGDTEESGAGGGDAGEEGLTGEVIVTDPNASGDTNETGQANETGETNETGEG